MVVTYRNNRLVPAIIITLCVVLIFYLVDPSVENYGLSSAAEDYGSSSSASPASPPPPSYQDSIAQEKEFYEEQAKEYADASSTPVPSSGTKPKQQTPSHGHDNDDALTDDDILLIVKTGGTSMWKRLLAHLPTTLSPARISPSHIAIYSDQAASIGPFTVVDALANSSSAAKSSLEFDVYRQQAEYNAYNRYVEASGVAGDEWGPVGGWTVDKYKFLPLMDHAGRAWPRAKWYVYMEDDSYLFLPEVRRHLSRFDHARPHYLGSYAAKSGFVFAHGGAGFALSRGAWEASFGAAGPNITEDYFDYTATHCCGDQVLGKALKDHGVSFGENGGDEGFTFGFNPVVHWVFAFSKSNWCKPLLSWHKVHSRDVAEYFAFEQTWDFSKPLLHRDFFANMILPRLNSSVEWWENGAAAFEVSSGNQEWAPVPDKSAPGGSVDAKAWKEAWQSSEACAAACRGWEACMMWEYVEDLCKMDDNLRMGQGYAPGMTERKTSLMHTSGWIIDRVDEWVC